MAFQTKNFTSIVAGMVNQIRASGSSLTDFRVGSVNRTLVEAPAIEIDQLYQNMLLGLVESIPASVYLAFGFPLLTVSYAYGLVTFSVATPAIANVLIPSGTLVSTANGTRSYATSAAVTILAGQSSVSATVQSATPGSQGNAAAGEVSVMVSTISGVSVTNPVSFANGADAETESQRQARFKRYLSTLSRGPIESIQYGAEQSFLTDVDGNITERVTSANVVEAYLLSPDNPLGYLDVYIYNGAATSSPALIARALEVLNGYVDGGGARVPGYKAAGVVLRVYSVAVATFNPTLLLRTVDGALTAAQSAAVDLEVASYINATSVGATIYLAQIEAAALRVGGVIDATVSMLGGDANQAPSTKATFGAATYIVSKAT